MKCFLGMLGCCVISVCAFAQQGGFVQKKISLVPDSSITLLRAPYNAAPARLDLSIRTPGTTPFFCRQEVKWEQALKFPLRIRLGSVDQANWLEQKGDRYLLFK